VPVIAADALTFGFIKRPWDTVSVDSRYPNLGFMDIEHFDPTGFAPQTPLVRWARASWQDLGWMARKIARLERAHVEAIVQAGRLSREDERVRMVDVLMGRRETILRRAFENSSPLADFRVVGSRTFCATDLSLRTGISSRENHSYQLSMRQGRSQQRSSQAPEQVATDALDAVCIALAPHFAPSDAAPDAEERYSVLEVRRRDGRHNTVLRAHFYDQGPEQGYALVGIERL
jgi:hypothetical protein